MNPYYSFLQRFLINIESLSTCPPNLHFVPHTLLSEGAEKYENRLFWKRLILELFVTSN